MKKLFKLINSEFKKNKKYFIFITILLIIGFVTGSFFITILSSDDKKLVSETISGFFNQVKNNKVDIIYLLRTSLSTNLIYIIFIWLLGISIIGIPIIIFLVFIKSFIIGFSLSGIIYHYNIKGILLSLSYIFPHQIINLVAISFIGLYALKVSISLIKLIISKKQINFKNIMKKYFAVLIICIILVLISSVFESFVCPYLIKLFLLLIK